MSTVPDDDTEAPQAQTFPRPVTFSGALGVAWRTFRGRFHTLAALFIGVYLVAGALPYAIFAALPGVGRTIAGPQVLYLTATFALSVCTAIAAIVVVDEHAGVSTTTGRAWASVRPRLRDLFIASLLTSLLALLLSQVLFAGYVGFLLTVALVMGPPVLAQVLTIEGLALGPAWIRTKEILKAQWGRTIMYLFNIALVAAFLTAFAVQSFIIETRDAPDLLSFVVTRIIEAIIYAGIAAFIAVLQTTIYLDIRARKEGLDEPGLIEERKDRSVPIPD